MYYPLPSFIHGPDQYLEAVVDDHVAVEERPLALNVLEQAQLPRLIVQSVGVLPGRPKFKDTSHLLCAYIIISASDSDPDSIESVNTDPGKQKKMAPKK
jgi:hypothetical protein